MTKIKNTARNMLSSDRLDALLAPVTEREANTLVGAAITIGGTIISGGNPLAGGLIGLACTAADERATRDNYRGVGAIAAGAVATGSTAVAAGALGAAMAVNRIFRASDEHAPSKLAGKIRGWFAPKAEEQEPAPKGRKAKA